MRTIILLLILALSFINAQSQTLLIVDKSTLQPLQFAQIETGKSVLTSDANGNVDISKVLSNQTFTVRQIGYQPVTLTSAQLKMLNYQVSLTEKAFDLNEVIVSASKFEERQRDVAQQIQVLRSKELQFMSQPTSAEVLQQSGNVLVQKSQLGGGSPIMRGFEASKILLVIGHELGEASRKYDRFLLINKQLIADGNKSEVITADNIQRAYGDCVILVQREID